MFIHSDRLGGHLLLQVLANRMKKTVVLSMRDLDLFASLCMARFILWKTTRKSQALSKI